MSLAGLNASTVMYYSCRIPSGCVCVCEIASGSVFLESANECVKGSASVQAAAQSTESKLPSPHHAGAVPGEQQQ